MSQREENGEWRVVSGEERGVKGDLRYPLLWGLQSFSCEHNYK